MGLMDAPQGFELGQPSGNLPDWLQERGTVLRGLMGLTPEQMLWIDISLNRSAGEPYQPYPVPREWVVPLLKDADEKVPILEALRKGGGLDRGTADKFLKNLIFNRDNHNDYANYVHGKHRLYGPKVWHTTWSNAYDKMIDTIEGMAEWR